MDIVVQISVPDELAEDTRRYLRQGLEAAAGRARSNAEAQPLRIGGVRNAYRYHLHAVARALTNPRIVHAPRGALDPAINPFVV